MSMKGKPSVLSLLHPLPPSLPPAFFLFFTLPKFHPLRRQRREGGQGQGWGQEHGGRAEH